MSVVLSCQSSLILCDPMDHSSTDSSVHGIHQARILKWVTILSSRGSPQPRDKPMSLASPALAGELSSATWEALKHLLNGILTSPLPAFAFFIWARSQFCEDPPILFTGGSRAITWLTVDFQYAFVEWRKESMKSQVLGDRVSTTIYGRAKPILLPPQGLWTHTFE